MEDFSFLRVFIAMEFLHSKGNSNKERYCKAATQNVSTQYAQWLSHTCMCGAQLLYSPLPMFSNTALHFSVERGAKPAGTQGKFPPLRWLSHRCKWRILLLPSLFQAMYSSSFPNPQGQHVIRAEFHTVAWERSCLLRRRGYLLCWNINNQQTWWWSHPLWTVTADHAGCLS